MRVIKPPKLKQGDLVGIISPASSPDDLTRIERGVKYFEKIGYRTIVGENVGQYRGYLAGDDDNRISDLHKMFSNKDVKAIFTVRGGYGSPRLLDRINYNLIKKNPKVFVGYSDITALHLAFYQKAGLVTFAGPMVAVDFHNEVSPFTEEIFWGMVTSNKKIGRLPVPLDEKLFTLIKGSTEGRLIGGNLALVLSLAGTEYMPPFKDKILFLEDIGENPYRIDRMLNQLKLMKVFKQIKGVILGTFTDCNENDPEKRSLSLNEVIFDYFSKFKIPVIYNFQHGHIKNNITLPMGLKYKLNATKCFVEINESAVR